VLTQKIDAATVIVMNHFEERYLSRKGGVSEVWLMKFNILIFSFLADMVGVNVRKQVAQIVVDDVLPLQIKILIV